MIAYYYPPVRGGGTGRPVKMSKYLSRLGHHVTVCTHTDKKENVCFSDDLIRIHDISHNMYRNGWGKWVWFFLRVYSEMSNRLGKYHSIYSWWKRSVLKQSERIMRHVKPDLLLVTYPPVETLEIGLAMSKAFFVPLISDFRDGLTFEPVESRPIDRFPCVRDYYKRLETDTVNGSSAIITASPPITDDFIHRYNIDNVKTVLNGFDPDQFKGIPENPGISQKYFNMVFTGKFSASDGQCLVDPFIEALIRVKEEDPEIHHKFRLHLVGYLTPREKRLFKKLSDGGVVCYHGEYSQAVALSFQKYADMLLLITSTDRSSVITTKVFEYLYFNKPILALTHQTEAAKMISRVNGGIVIHPEDVDRMVQFFHALFKQIKEGKVPKGNTGDRTEFSFLKSVSVLDELIQKIPEKG